MRSWLLGALVALLGFAGLGTVSALWPNPMFMRMTSAGAWEISLLAAFSLLGGLYVALRRPACADRTAGAVVLALAVTFELQRRHSVQGARP